MLTTMQRLPLWTLDAEGAASGGAATADKTDTAEGAADKSGAAEGGAVDGATGKGDDKSPTLGATSDAEKKADPISLALSDDVRAALLASLPENDRDPAGKFLKTRASIADLLKSGMGADKKISQLTAELKSAIKPINDNATPEEVAAYRKVLGIPDKPEGYKAYRPDGMEFTEGDKAAETRILAKAHALHVPPAQLNGILQEYYALQAEVASERAAAVKVAQEAGVSELHGEYGKQFQPLMNLADRYLGEILGPDMGDDWKGLMKTEFADGRTLASHPGFVKAIVKLAKAHYDDGMMEIGGDGAMDVDAEIKKLMGKMGTDEYERPEVQQRLDSLIAAQQKRKGRAA